MNDVNLKEYAALVISEPYVLEMEGKVTTSPMGHQGWTAVLDFFSTLSQTGSFIISSDSADRAE
jgi:hypothetical protein